MGKVLIAAFDDKDEIAFDELLLFLKSNSHIKVVNAFPNDSCLKYDNLIIDSKYRMVEADGKSIELTNYEFDTCWHDIPDRYFLKSKYTIRCGKSHITGQRTM